ncbi:hypothetical protein GW17_00040337 [Ensete ventricosum]|nr:hypothetical protein GW17_00040337 [Ensete ventricosum]
MGDLIMRRYNQGLLGAPLRRTTQRQEGLWIQGVNVMAPQRRVFRMCASNLASDEKPWSSTYEDCVPQRRIQIASTSNSHGGLDYTKVVKRDEEATTNPEGLNYPKAKCRSERRWTKRSVIVPTSMESSIPCSHGGRALLVKGPKEMENAEANSKYQDKDGGQRPRNFIRPVSMSFLSR